MTGLALRSKYIAAVLLAAVLITAGVACGGANQRPTIMSLVANPTSLAPGGGSTVSCEASDADGDTLSYAWEYTGGTLQGTGSTVTWIAPSVVNTYTVKVSVSDGKGGVANSSVTIAVTAPTEGSIDIKSNPVGAEVFIDGNDTKSITPYLATHVASGNHTVELKYAHYVWRQGTVAVTGGEIAYVNWALTYADDQTLVIQPGAADGKDAQVYEYTPDTNEGLAGGMGVGEDAAAQRIRIYIQFSVSSIPATAVVENATLGLYYVSSGSTSIQGPVGVYRVTSLWNESAVTWNSQPTFNTAVIDTVLIPAGPTYKFLLWNVTSLVNGWRGNSAGNYGMVLMDSDEKTNEGWKSFMSAESADVGTHPKLTITYYDPTP